MEVKIICGDCGSENVTKEPEYEISWECVYDDDGYADEYDVEEFIGYTYHCQDCGSVDLSTL